MSGDAHAVSGDASAGNAATDRSWSPCGVVALLTDFGLDDSYVGQMKGVLHTRFPEVRIVDVTHGIPPQAIRIGAFQLAASAPYFPLGTVFVAVVDPEVGTQRRILVARDRGRVFLAPDNGLLPAALSADAHYGELDGARFASANTSRTFHGRDVFAPAAAELARGLDPERAIVRDVGDPRVLPRLAAARVTDERVEAHVLFADRYGNLVLDVGPDALAGGPSAWCAEVGARRIPFAATYAEVAQGELLLLADSFGALEIARRDGSAAEVLDLAPGDGVVLTRRR